MKIHCCSQKYRNKRGVSSGSRNYFGKLGSMKKGRKVVIKKFILENKDLGLLKRVRKQERLSLETRHEHSISCLILQP